MNARCPICGALERHRLETAGFEVQLFEASELLDRNTLYKFGIRQGQRVVFCVKEYDRKSCPHD